MTNALFNEVSANQQETVAGGFSLNFSGTTFLGLQTASGTTSTSTPDGSNAIGENAVVDVNTSGGTANGLDLPANFDLAALFSSFFGGMTM
ncbi:CTB family bacteriocin [Nodularia harveyana UHCC-0300]|uniref:CTB family bacteriocin n=1 Tax=Nodularia harveyana UHCC-0300 TaxID=2974287 RepID=A0ABU5U8C8_9CYAN|nr:CTB family bacteriocin [Nodularia harveyana]MEA5579772.1 CTB family bacteriocin [Nodularia harveyana UHCC-0300]